jgi:alpha-ketoglutaric semialdehyde dehydrogenase
LELLSKSIIGFRTGRGGGATFRAEDPITGKALEPEFTSALSEEVDEAAQLAAEAFTAFGRVTGKRKGQLLRLIAISLEAIHDLIVERAHLETSLPKARLEGELARTAQQLRLFASLVEEGSWVAARIEHADLERKSNPRPDLRSMLRPLGPVVVFGASNFPLAFSVAGGDTASALAAGNPVIVKAHSAHPGTSELVGHVIRESIFACDLPEGIFSMLFDSGTSVGKALVMHPEVKAVGFTGSHAGGRALFDLAMARPKPIPVLAEMGSTNPVFVLPRALRARRSQIASGLFTSFTLGAGQFCTKPGLVFVPEGPDSASFIRDIETQVAESFPFFLLTSGIRDTFRRATSERNQEPHVRSVVSSQFSVPDVSSAVSVAFSETDAGTFLSKPELAKEIFGPTTLVVRHSTKKDLFEIVASLEGHLAAAVHGTAEDFEEFAEVIHLLEEKVGRIVCNGFPTGVEVSPAMVHGGPYPATCDSRYTSVGTQAILRFARPICFQDCPASLLPDELKDANPLKIWRHVDGQMKR